jgi:hypothetical protein
MITLPEYQVMGEDGQEYGPVSPDQIRKWYLEQRVERKSPVKPSEAKDWVFLESLPEFADLFQPPDLQSKRQPRKWPAVVLVVGILAALAVGLIMLALKILNHS